jgi:hypothetical protein
MGRGRRSSVNFGVMVNSDRVRKSSACTEGVAKVDTVCAADLIARKEAVRFDLKLDFRRGNDGKGLGDLVVAGSGNG